VLKQLLLLRCTPNDTIRCTQPVAPTSAAKKWPRRQALPCRRDLGPPAIAVSVAERSVIGRAAARARPQLLTGGPVPSKTVP